MTTPLNSLPDDPESVIVILKSDQNNHDYWFLQYNFSSLARPPSIFVHLSVLKQISDGFYKIKQRALNLSLVTRLPPHSALSLSSLTRCDWTAWEVSAERETSTHTLSLFNLLFKGRRRLSSSYSGSPSGSVSPPADCLDQISRLLNGLSRVISVLVCVCKSVLILHSNSTSSGDTKTKP